MAISKTLQQMANQVGKTIKYYDGSTWKTGRDVTEADIKEYINLLWQDEVFPLFVNENPSYYRKTSTFDSWIASGTAATGLSGSTLVATTSIFTSSMADQRLYVYNADLDESTYITAYTSATTVTVNDTDISDWDGDSIYVLGQEFSFGGDGTDLWTVTGVSLLYSSADTRYREAAKTQREDIFVTGYETGSKVYPEWYDTSVLVSDAWQTAIGVWPKMDAKLSKAIRIERTAKPGTLGDSDSPRLPVSLPLINGATAWAFRQKGGDETKRAMEFQKLYEGGVNLALQNWRPDRGVTARKIRTSQNHLRRRAAYR
jgi:hypothetical protein